MPDMNELEAILEIRKDPDAGLGDAIRTAVTARRAD
jgi:hypothetical protein